MDSSIFRWNEKKNILLKNERNICFEDVITSLRSDKLLDIVKNPSANREGQYCFIIDIAHYAYVVPFVKDGDSFFLKTIYPSRKQTKKYLQE